MPTTASPASASQAASYLSAVQRVVHDVVGPEAEAVDRTGSFPRRSIDALAGAGLLALTVPQEYGGGGSGLRAAADVVRTIGAACGSTAMVVTMHYSATAALLAGGRADELREIGAGRHLSTLAFSEYGSRSHFWAPVSTAVADSTAGNEVTLEARKSWVTAAGEADGYVWSSRPLAAAGPMTLWYVPAATPGLSVPAAFDGLGLRGNASSPITGVAVRIPRQAMLGEDGGGLDLALSAVLPVFLVLNAAASVGLMEAVTAETTEHLSKTRLEHLDQSLAEQAVPRAQLARLRIATDRTRAHLDETIRAVDEGRPDAQLLVLEIKAAAGEAAAEAADIALRACGGSAFRKESPIERRFRDSRAARVMAPTTDALLDFVGRALCGLPLLDGAA
jgi:alkylation response protein AidB-like acyl-CoA dehydrogenase